MARLQLMHGDPVLREQLLARVMRNGQDELYGKRHARDHYNEENSSNSHGITR